MRRLAIKCFSRQIPILILGLGIKWLAGAATADDGVFVTPKAVVETETKPNRGDATDDPAIWIHPDNPARSLSRRFPELQVLRLGSDRGKSPFDRRQSPGTSALMITRGDHHVY